jgi:N6-L-threonylcarbamoyladenine synthase
MIILGIETSCDDTSIAILKESNQIDVLSFDIYSQTEMLNKWGGVVPEIAARNHLEKLPILLKNNFEKAQIKIEDIDLIAVTTNPGLLGPLLTGINAAKTISMLNKKPIVPINHLLAHIEVIHLTEKVSYPYLGLIVSGGHTLFVWVESFQHFKVIGTTIDDAAGEAFDKGGKLMGLDYPAGKIIDELAIWGDCKKYSFPLGLIKEKNAHTSFSGLKTALRYTLEEKPELLNLKPQQFLKKEDHAQNFYDLVASYQEAITETLKIKMKNALALAPIKNCPIVVGGGVAANSNLRTKLKNNFNNKIHFVPPKYCTDNAVMIAHLGLLQKNMAVSYPDCLELDAKSKFIDKKEYFSR